MAVGCNKSIHPSFSPIQYYENPCPMSHLFHFHPLSHCPPPPFPPGLCLQSSPEDSSILALEAWLVVLDSISRGLPADRSFAAGETSC